MGETKHILVLANSARSKKHCVAGKEVWFNGNGECDVGSWIRLADPTDPQGAVAFAHTYCEKRGPVRPLDIIEVSLKSSCGNKDHPEDYFFDPSRKWKWIAQAGFENLADLQDRPPKLWSDNTFGSRSVAGGYVSRMGTNAASLYLIQAPIDWQFTFWKEQVPDAEAPGNIKDKHHRDLAFRYANQPHQFSVTDPEFTRRHNLWDRMANTPQLFKVPDPENVFLCLSLTPEYKGRHYKICATVFEK